jgi:hypothetical protein
VYICHHSSLLGASCSLRQLPLYTSMDSCPMPKHHYSIVSPTEVGFKVKYSASSWRCGVCITYSPHRLKCPYRVSSCLEGSQHQP